MSEDRLGRSAKRGSKSSGVTRKSRIQDNRSQTQNRTITDDDRLDMFRRSFFQSVLPDLPPIPGYHVCWLTTTNPRDSIMSRLRLGYELIRAEEYPEFASVSIKTGEYAGCIGVNEMIAAKLPVHLYESYMYEAHHVQPLEEERKLSSIIDVIKDAASREAKSGSRGIKLDVEDGMTELGVDREPSSFAHAIGEE